jgi:hypothetical protein
MRQLDISLAHQMRRVILPMLSLLAASCLAGIAMRAATRTAPDLVVVLAGSAAAAGTGFALFYLWILSPEERQIVVRLLRRFLPAEAVA